MVTVTSRVNVVDKPGALRALTLASYERDGPLGLTYKPKTSVPGPRVTFTDLVVMPYRRIVPY